MGRKYDHWTDLCDIKVVDAVLTFYSPVKLILIIVSGLFLLIIQKIKILKVMVAKLVADRAMSYLSWKWKIIIVSPASI